MVRLCKAFYLLFIVKKNENPIWIPVFRSLFRIVQLLEPIIVSVLRCLDLVSNIGKLVLDRVQFLPNRTCYDPDCPDSAEQDAIAHHFVVHDFSFLSIWTSIKHPENIAKEKKEKGSKSQLFC